MRTKEQIRKDLEVIMEAVHIPMANTSMMVIVVEVLIDIRDILRVVHLDGETARETPNANLPEPAR